MVAESFLSFSTIGSYRSYLAWAAASWRKNLDPSIIDNRCSRLAWHLGGPDWSPLGVYLKFLNEHPRPFSHKSPPGLLAVFR